MTVDGNFLPCERVSEQSDTFIIGNVNEGFFMDKVLKILNIGNLTQEDCKNVLRLDIARFVQIWHIPIMTYRSQ